MKYRIDAIIAADRPDPDGHLDLEMEIAIAEFDSMVEAVEFVAQIRAAMRPGARVRLVNSNPPARVGTGL
jgi:hypothetical protein